MAMQQPPQLKTLSYSPSLLSARPSSVRVLGGHVLGNSPGGAARECGNGAVSCSGISSTEGLTQRERQEILWQHFFSNPSDWWDNRADKRSSRHPDFRNKSTKEALWLDNYHKPAWVDSQLARGHGDGEEGSANRDSNGLELACRDVQMSGKDGAEQDVLIQCCEEAELSEAVDALEILVERGCHIGRGVFYRVLKRCMARKDLDCGRRVHALALRKGFASHAFLANHIIGMYAGHGKLEDAVQAFSNVARPDAFMWSSIILAHARQGQPIHAINLYRQMRGSGVKADAHIFVAALKACASAGDLDSGKEVHADIQASAAKADFFVGSSLVNMYVKCGSLDDARSVFDSLPRRDVVTWTAMIAGYSQQGNGQEALSLYASMEREDITPADSFIFVRLIQACANVGALQQGKQLHSKVRARGLNGDVFIGSALVHMYSKCGLLEEARKVFDSLPRRDVVSWTSMIAGYSQQGLGQEALDLYASMQNEGITPADSVTFLCLLQACATVGSLQQGKELHLRIREQHLESDAVIPSSLVNMYAKCGSLEDARNVFDTVPRKNVGTWNAMIAGYVRKGLGREALSLYASMQHEGIAPADQVTFVCMLQACANVGALEQGKQIHSHIRAGRFEGDTMIGSCLVDMYSKCGSLADARNVFDELPSRNSVTWTAMLKGYAEHSDGNMAIRCFEDMLQQGVQPDETTFTCLLAACSHMGLVNEGQRYFRMMVEDHGIVPSEHHHSCMADLLGRSGQLNEAEHLLRTTALNDVVGWTALLSACKNHGDVERGERCFDHLVKLEPENASPYVMLGNIYANAGRWDDVDKTEIRRKAAGASKKAAKACIEVKNEVHEFTVGEERSDVSPKLRSVNSRLKEEGGHVPQTKLVLKAVTELEKEDALCGHAEKLALAYGLLNTPEGTTLVVTKNLRMCTDCHSSTKIMSSLEKREIVVRDGHRVHKFVNGSCSCGDRH